MPRHPMSFGKPPPLYGRLLCFLGHLDSRIYWPSGAWLDVGAGSLSVAPCVQPLDPAHAGAMGSVGRFSEFAAGSSVLFGGDHDNERTINVNFNGAAMLQSAAMRAGMATKPPSPISIGDGVIVSRNAVLLSGARVGTGAVVAAGAVVRHDVEPFSVVGGVPARKLKDRFAPEVRDQVQAVAWWDFDPEYMQFNMAALKDLVLDRGVHRYRPERPRIAIRFDPARSSYTVDGMAAGDELVPLDRAPEGLRAYIQMMAGDGPYYWQADPWEDG